MKSPPILARKLIQWSTPVHYFEMVDGDLQEAFHQDVTEYGLAFAKRKYWQNALENCSRFSFKNKSPYRKYHSQNPLDMYKNYLKIAFRNLSKNTLYSGINIFGLAVGLSSCFLIVLYLNFETSFENFHSNKKEIYRLIPHSGESEDMKKQLWTPPGMAPFLQSQFNEITEFCRYSGIDKPFLQHKTTTLPDKSIALADPSFFTMFSIPVLVGEPTKVLQRPNTIVLSKTIADSFFEGKNPIGKTIRYNNEFDLEVTGVFADLPANTQMEFDYIVSFSTIGSIYQRYGMPAEEALGNFHSWNYTTYLQVPEPNGLDVLEKRFTKALVERKGGTWEEGSSYYWLQPLLDVHFDQSIKGDGKTSNKEYVSIFSIVALFILVIACLNFMNLSTARAMKRAKEVGLRKVMGAGRSNLIGQFLGEAIVMVSIAMVLSFFLFEISRPFFFNLIGYSIPFDYQENIGLVLSLIGLSFVTGILAGAYPAFYLSSFQPAKVLKSQNKDNANATFRKVITIFQFVIAMFMIVGTLAVYQQMDYMKNKPLGFDKSEVIYFSFPYAKLDKFPVFKTNLKKNSKVKEVTISNSVPGMLGSHWSYEWVDKGERQRRNLNTFIMGFDFQKVYGLELVEGRWLDATNPSDSTQGYILNEKAVEEMMLENPIGTPIKSNSNETMGIVVGVVKDFHYKSLHHPVEPLAMRMDAREASTVSVKVDGDSFSNTLSFLKTEFESIDESLPFDYAFLDESLQNRYKAESRVSILLSIFSALAIFVACLGLFGLASFMAVQRQKEIGVRKVLGASVRGIVLMMSKDFARLILVSFVLMLPLAWYFIDQWIVQFAYRVEVGFFLYALGGFFVFLLAFITIGFQSVKAATTNPVEILRNE